MHVTSMLRKVSSLGAFCAVFASIFVMGYQVRDGGVCSGGGDSASASFRSRSSVASPCPAGRCSNETVVLVSGVPLPRSVVELLRFSLSPGWNLTGSPSASDATIAEIFSGAEGFPIKVGNLQYWSPAESDYVESSDGDPLVGELGFWVFSYWGGAGQTFEPGKGDLREDWQASLQEGWNLYSPPYHVTVPTGGDIVIVWGWDSESGSYEVIPPGRNILPLKGYWILKQAR